MTQRVLEHTLQVAPDFMLKVKKLHDHVVPEERSSAQEGVFHVSEAERRKSFDDFFVRLKSLCEEIDVCAAYNTECEEK